MENLRNWLGAIIGVIIGILFVIFDVLNFVLSVAIIVGFGFLGSYIQKNKISLKEKLKNFIDKI